MSFRPLSLKIGATISKTFTSPPERRKYIYQPYSPPLNLFPSTPVGHDPFNYTSGHWLRRDALERKARCVRFDFDALCSKVISLCPGARSVTSYSKIEGGYNRVFIFRTDNAHDIVARLPFSVAGPARLSTSSEVATIKYRTYVSAKMERASDELKFLVQAKTSIPIPRILDWSASAPKTIGSEYIIMDHAPGVCLHQRWPTMSLGEQLRCIGAIYGKLKEVANLRFPAYGSLYFADMPYLASSKILLDDEFCIGPHCGPMYWDCNVGQPRYYNDAEPNQGPWKTFTQYCDGLVDSGLARLPPASSPPNQPPYQGSVHTHRRLLEQGRAIIHQIAADPRMKPAARPVLFHPDLHKRNIFVSDEDSTVITAIIDWQSSSIQPAFRYADETPDFAETIPDPSNEHQLEPKSEACAKAHHVATQLFTPALCVPSNIDESLLRLFQYCSRTWRDGAAAFREDLIQASLQWEKFGFEGVCPYPVPCAAEMLAHRKEYEIFESVLQMRHFVTLKTGADSEGWVAPELWEEAKLVYDKLYDMLLVEVIKNKDDEDETIRDEASLRKIWPFDVGT